MRGSERAFFSVKYNFRKYKVTHKSANITHPAHSKKTDTAHPYFTLSCIYRQRARVRTVCGAYVRCTDPPTGAMEDYKALYLQALYTHLSTRR